MRLRRAMHRFVVSREHCQIAQSSLLAKSVAVVGRASLEKILDEVGRRYPHENEQIANDGGEECKGSNFRHRVLLEAARSTQALPFFVEIDEPCAPQATKHTKEEPRYELKAAPDL